MDNQTLFLKVRALNLPLGKYALFGSAPLGVRNLRDCHDIDIIMTEDTWNEYQNKTGWTTRTRPSGDNYLEWEDIELCKNWWPGTWNIQQLIDNAEIIDGLPFVRLEDVIRWKRSRGREKDSKDIVIIENFLKAGQ
jgi:hypothetical protein